MLDYICGIETEFATHPLVYDFLTGEDPHDRQRSPRALLRLGMLNGGRPYVDQNSFEIATPECATVNDAALYDKASELVAAFVGDYACDGKYQFYKNNVAFKTSNPLLDAAYGRHESWSFYRNDEYGNKEPVTLALGSSNAMHLFLATRTMTDGSGFLDRNGMYRTSQRAAFVNEALELNNNRRPTNMCFVKDDFRAHICTGDSTQSDVQTYFNMAITRIALELIISGKIYISAEPSEIARVFTELPYRFKDFKEYLISVKTGNQRYSANPFQVQRDFLEVAETEGYDNSITSEWKEKLDILECGDYMQLKQEFDWVTKLWSLQRSTKRRGCSMRSPEAKMLDLIFHRIGSKEENFGIYQKLRAMGRIKTRFTDGKIKNAAFRPPSNTRAKGRSDASAYGLRPNFNYWNSSDFFARNTDETPKSFVAMSYPFKTYEEDVKKLATAHGLIYRPENVLPRNLKLSLS